MSGVSTQQESSEPAEAKAAPTANTNAVTINGLRLIAEHEGTFYKIARIQWSNKDASLYVLPYMPSGGTAFAGVMKIPDQEQGASTFNFARGVEGAKPKMSLHEFGQCRASVGDQSIAQVWGRKLHDQGGGHIGTIECCSFEGLPTIDPPKGPPEPDLVVDSEGAEWHGVRIPILVYLAESDAARHPFYVSTKRPYKPTLFVAVHVYPSKVDPTTAERGVLVYAGWGPGAIDRPTTGVYVITHPGAQSTE